MPVEDIDESTGVTEQRQIKFVGQVHSANRFIVECVDSSNGGKVVELHNVSGRKASRG